MLSVSTKALAAIIFALFLSPVANVLRAQSEKQNKPEQEQCSPSDANAKATCNPSQTSSPAASSIPGVSSPPNSVVDGSVSLHPADPGDPPKRILGMMPDFVSTNDVPQNQKPLTVGQKYILSLNQAFDFSAHIGDAFQSAVQQAANAQPHYGRGGAAYGERFLASEADQVTSSILIYGFFPTVLHEDPRYFRRGKGTAASRIWYAVTRTFVTRRDTGKNRFNTSQTLGQLVSSGISTSYYPPVDRSVSGVFLNWAVNLGYNSGYNVVTEYYADLVHAVGHRHKNALDAAAN